MGYTGTLFLRHLNQYHFKEYTMTTTPIQTAKIRWAVPRWALVLVRLARGESLSVGR